MGIGAVLKSHPNWLQPDDDNGTSLADTQMKQGNPVTGHFAKKLEVWRNTLIKKPEKQLPTPTLEKLNQRVGVHQKAMEHLKTLKDDFTT
ncbi:MAG: hypothetical protein HQL51_13860, partial [Magnetococcales bacterium]|nr:hypothetical protein [Magnetococcales bacterium]